MANVQVIQQLQVSVKEEQHQLMANVQVIQQAPGFCEGGAAPVNGECPGDPAAPGFCEGGAAPVNGECPGDPDISRHSVQEELNQLMANVLAVFPQHSALMDYHQVQMDVLLP